mgnify:CR=1 FL=1
MFRKGLVFRVIGALLFIALLVAGGVMVFKAGEVRGVSQAPAVATAISQAAENGQVAPVPPMMYQYGYGYGPGFYPHMGGFHHFGFFPFGICGSIFFLFLFLGIMRMIFFRGMWQRGWEGHKHGPWSKNWEGGVPPMFNEWHKRAHDEKPAEDGDKKE